jgi:hypothetical protein
MLPGTEPGVSGLGKSPQILPGALVFGIFLDGIESQVPMVIGSMPRKELPNSNQNVTSGQYTPNQYNKTNQVSEFVHPDIPDPTVQGDVTITQRQNRTIVMKFFIDNGYTQAQAAGMTGVLEVGAQFNPKGLGGIAGWSGTRYQKLTEYTKTLGPLAKIDNLAPQLLYILHELKTSHRAAAGELQACTWMTDEKNLGRGSAAVFLNLYYPNPGLDLQAAEQAANSIYNIAGTA